MLHRPEWRITLITGNTKMVLAVIAINSVSTGGLVAVTLRQRPAIGAPVRARDPSPGPMVRMEPLIIQLRRGPEDNSERYLRIAFDLEMKNEGDRSAYVYRLSRISDSMISYFSDRTPGELRGGDGIEHIKEAMSERLKTILPGHVPKTIYVTDFLIQ